MIALNRRSLTPSLGIPAQGIPATRRGGGGARREISSRISLVSDGNEYNGWALNISRGGIRVVIEERVELGQEFEIRELDADIADGGPFRGRVVWVQDEPDGSVVGMEFVGPELPKFAEKPGSTAHPPSSTTNPALASPSPTVAATAPAAAPAPAPASEEAQAPTPDSSSSAQEPAQSPASTESKD